MSEVETWLPQEDHCRTQPSSIGPARDAIEARVAAAASPAALDEMTPQLVRVVDTDGSWGLLLVPVAVCVALFVYAGMFFS